MTLDVDVDVVVPTFARPAHLAACLESLLRQDFPGTYRLLVVHRADDEATLRVLRPHASNGRVEPVLVEQPGFLRALRAGLAAATGTYVAFTDDDALYPENWLARLVELLQSPGVVGAGGVISEEGLGCRREAISRIAHVSFSGRLHFHLYDQMPSKVVPVHFLSGANMAYRRAYLRPEHFPMVLQLAGGAPMNETFVGASLRKAGGTLVCDTALAVTHVRAPRAEGSRAAERASVRDLARSRAYLMRLALSRPGWIAFLVRMIVLGDSLIPGLAGAFVKSGGRRHRLSDVVEAARGYRDASCIVGT
jgi:glycosyltransferase involved in cell wall biosynthesis